MQMNVRTLARSGALLVTAGVFAVSATLVPVSVATAVSADDPTVSVPKKLLRLAQIDDSSARKAPEKYNPKTGVLTNDPRSKNKRRILYHILQSIRSTRHGQKIRIISWNIASRAFVDALIGANKRGVSVRLLMSENKAMAQPRDGDYWRLKRALRNRSDTFPQPKKLRSWARTCDRSCRGERGIAHSKIFVFSKVQETEYVVMSTSANATEVSVNSQWNDLYTLTGNRRIYEGFIKTFNESAKDRPIRGAYRTVDTGRVHAYFYPWKGSNARGDRVLQELKRIKCRGTQGGTGINNRTRIRIAQDAIIDERGKKIAWRLRYLWNQGCNIKIVYALMGKQVKGILNNGERGPIPRRQIVSDFDGDGIYDRYLHSKSMAVSGIYGNDRSARIAWQGSENWSGLAKLSDEQGFRLKKKGPEGRYARWVDYLYDNPPPPPPPTTMRRARANGIDPYALIKEELGR